MKNNEFELLLVMISDTGGGKINAFRLNLVLLFVARCNLIPKYFRSLQVIGAFLVNSTNPENTVIVQFGLSTGYVLGPMVTDVVAELNKIL